jgi:hypothetical protein
VVHGGSCRKPRPLVGSPRGTPWVTTSSGHFRNFGKSRACASSWDHVRGDTRDPLQQQVGITTGIRPREMLFFRTDKLHRPSHRHALRGNCSPKYRIRSSHCWAARASQVQTISSSTWMIRAVARIDLPSAEEAHQQVAACTSSTSLLSVVSSHPNSVAMMAAQARRHAPSSSPETPSVVRRNSTSANFCAISSRTA